MPFGVVVVADHRIELGSGPSLPATSPLYDYHPADGGRFLFRTREGFAILSPGRQEEFPFSGMKAIQSPRLTKDAIVFVDGDTPRTRRLVRVPVETGVPEVVGVDSHDRSPLIQVSEHLFFYLHRFNQDPAIENRAGWVQVELSDAPRMRDGTLLIYLKGVRGVNAAGASELIASCDHAGKVVRRLGVQSNSEEILGHPSISPDQNAVAYCAYRYDGPTHVRIQQLAPDSPPFVDFEIPGGSPFNSPVRWLGNGSHIIIGLYGMDDERRHCQHFRVVEVRTGRSCQLPIEADSDSKFFVDPADTLIYRSRTGGEIRKAKLQLPVDEQSE